MAPAAFSILLTDDDAHFHFLLKRMFELCSVPHEIIFLMDGVQLLEFLDRPQRPRLDCIVIDLNMPRKNGFEALLEIRKKNLARNTPIVVASHASGEHQAEKAIGLGAQLYLEKPSGIDEFKTFIAKLLETAETR